MGDLSGLQVAEALFDPDDVTVGGENGGNRHDVQMGDARISQRELEGGQFFLVDTHSFGKKHVPGNIHVSALLSRRKPGGTAENTTSTGAVLLGRVLFVNDC
jgi:hypothetical protein